MSHIAAGTVFSNMSTTSSAHSECQCIYPKIVYMCKHPLCFCEDMATLPSSGTNDSPKARSMSLHHGLAVLLDKHLFCFTCPLYILSWFQATYQASLRFYPRPKLTMKQWNKAVMLGCVCTEQLCLNTVNITRQAALLQT